MPHHLNVGMRAAMVQQNVVRRLFIIDEQDIQQSGAI